jgi:TRAP-type transport system periplasmic protein
MLTGRREMLGGAVAAVASFCLPRISRGESIKAKQYHVQPESSHLHIYLTKIWDAVRLETAGRLDVTVYPGNNGVSEGEPELLKQVQLGALELFTLNGNILSNAHPSADIQGIPFAFSTSRQLANCNDGEFGAYLRRELAAMGVQLLPFGAMENGFKDITTTIKPVHKSADLHGFKMRVPNGKIFSAFYTALGAEPKIVNFNHLYRALGNGEVEGQDNPLVIAEDNKLYEVCKYVTETSHQWAGFNMLASQDFWLRLPEDVQDSVIRNVRRFVPEQRAFVQAINATAKTRLRERGMVFVTADLTSFRGALSASGFYKTYRQSCGRKAWAMMESETGPIGGWD